jgi:GNAT superfamily N-acetyltransferase
MAAVGRISSFRPSDRERLAAPQFRSVTTNAITIRASQARDREAVSRLLKLLSEEAEVTASDAPAYVAERDGVVVGMVTLCVYTTLTGLKAYLDHVVVAADARRHGVGRALVEYAIKRGAGRWCVSG